MASELYLLGGIFGRESGCLRIRLNSLKMQVKKTLGLVPLFQSFAELILKEVQMRDEQFQVPSQNRHC